VKNHEGGALRAERRDNEAALLSVAVLRNGEARDTNRRTQKSEAISPRITNSPGNQRAHDRQGRKKLAGPSGKAEFS